MHTDDKRRRTYAGVAATHWEQRFHDLEEMERMQLDQVASMTQREGGVPPRAVLDIGCGTGRAAPLFPRERYLGIDQAAHFVRFCQEHRSAEGGSFLVADMDYLPFVAQAFDLVLLIGTLESETDLARQIGSIASYVRPGGRIHFTVQNRRNLFALAANLFAREYKQTFWRRSQVVRLMERGGYADVAMADLLVLPPGLARTLAKAVYFAPPLRRAVVSGVVALERLNRRFHWGLGYEWHVSVKLP
ncbi:MAG: class I SAM-dependent methyltransferase [Chloroflexi bacterium]|nr:class I SAM-dependent methyltransferase [Chloroflexota bacterium]